MDSVYALFNATNDTDGYWNSSNMTDACNAEAKTKYCLPYHQKLLKIGIPDLTINILALTTNFVAMVILKRNRIQSRMRCMMFGLSFTECLFQLLCAVYWLVIIAYPLALCGCEKGFVLYIMTFLSDAKMTALAVRNYWISLIAITRWDAIAKPLKPRFHRYGPSMYTLSMIVLYVVAGLSLASGYLIKENNACKHFTFYFTYTLLSDAVPFAIITVFGLLTIFKSNNTANQFNGRRHQSTRNASGKSLRRRKRTVTKTIMTLLVTFMICEIPFLIINLIFYLKFCVWKLNPMETGEISLLIFIAYIPTNIDSLMNFIIYFFCYTPFRRQVSSCVGRAGTQIPALASRSSGENDNYLTHKSCYSPDLDCGCNSHIPLKGRRQNGSRVRLLQHIETTSSLSGSPVRTASIL